MAEPPALHHPGMYVGDHADRPAVIIAETGASISFAELDQRSRRVANVFRSAGLRRGDHVAILLENHLRYFEIYWGAQRAGLYITPINWHLKADEVGYIVADCGASALCTSAAMNPVLSSLGTVLDDVGLKLMIDAAEVTTGAGFVDYETTVAAASDAVIDDEREGAFMYYSSGTTGRPKGIMPPLPDQPFGAGGGGLMLLLQFMYGVTTDSAYLSPAPLYHAAPLSWGAAAHRLGATIVVMERFDALRCLEFIERYEISHAQFVPTHFVRMLKLDDSERSRHTRDRLRVAIHAAAPCPIEIKQRMIDWWGPIIYEYYAGSEGNGFCAIDTPQWLAHPGSVGVPLLGKVHICDDDGNDVANGIDGRVWFESGAVFEYHNDPEKTASAFNRHGWSSLGDIGHVDDDGYLYLTDRASHMIISGGVNIYPQEVENELAAHPAVLDVAVIGVPHEDLGEAVKAVVIPAPLTPMMSTMPMTAGDDMANELIAYCRSRLAHYKCPTSIDFVDELPRLPNGKLLKRQLRDRYWQASTMPKSEA